MGRPELYTDELALKVCAEISTSQKSLRTICQDESLPSVQTILSWLRDKPDFLAQYTRAKEEQADFLTEQMLEIADDSSNDTVQGQYGPMENKEWVNRSRLRVDTRKWVASKLKPKKYGDKLDFTTGGESIPTTGMNEAQFNRVLEEAKNAAKANQSK